MEPETIHIAKLIAWPPMRDAYREFAPWITKALSAPELQLCHEASRGTLPGDIGPAMDWLSEETFRLSRGNPRGPGGKIKVTVANLSKTLMALREATERLATYAPDARLQGEIAFRGWLERAIVTDFHQEEPMLGNREDPVQQGIQRLQRLNGLKLAYDPAANSLCFPLASFKLNIKPKTPTGIEPFDMFELDGGAEEDTCMILAGESNIGKSHLGLHCLSRLAIQRHATILFSGEDSEDTTRRRIFAHYLRITDKEVAAMTELERAAAFAKEYGDVEDPESLHYHIANNVAMACIAEGTFTAKAMNEKIDAFEQLRQVPIKAFMADYLQKMNENVKNPRRQRDEELEFTVNQISDVCQTRKTLGIIISQVPSHAAGGGFEFLNLKQAVARSYAATWGAHYVITMNRPLEETNRLAGSADKRPRLNLFLCKNKNGPLGMCHALGYPNEARWEFYRTKPEMLARVDCAPPTRTQFDPNQARPNRNPQASATSI